MDVLICLLIILSTLGVLSDPVRRQEHPEESMDDHLIEGDIIPDEDDVSDDGAANRAAVKNTTFLWPGRIVPVKLEGFSEEGRVEVFKAMAALMQITCMKFREKLDCDPYFLKLQGDAAGCYSYVGRKENKKDIGQLVGLNKRCLQLGTIGHELMHAIGFWHEHSRDDRDSWIEVDYTHVKTGKSPQFRKRTQSESQELTPYDYDSVMHYDAFAFSDDGMHPTIIPKRTNLEAIGQRSKFSTLDIVKVNKLYRCNVEDTTPKDSRGCIIDIQPPKPTICPKAQPDSCKDDIADCVKFSRRGWCNMMPGFMLFKCKRSCCNCETKRCFDTQSPFHVEKFCKKYIMVDGTELRTPESCWNDESRNYVKKLCPKSCGLCQGGLGPIA